MRSHVGEGGAFFGSTERNLSHEDEDVVKAVCDRVGEWQAKKGAGGDSDETEEDEISVDCGDTSHHVIQQEIRRRYPNLWTFKGDIKQVVHNPCT